MHVEATGKGLLDRTEKDSWKTAAVMRPTDAAFSPGSILYGMSKPHVKCWCRAARRNRSDEAHRRCVLRRQHPTRQNK